MTTSIGAALRTYLLAWPQGNDRVYRDTAPSYGEYPQVTFVDPVSVVPVAIGDGRVTHFDRTIQVDLWQRRLQGGVPTEDFTLASDLMRYLDSGHLDIPDGKTTAMRVVQMVRVPDPDLDIVRHTVTITLRHDPTVG